MHIVESQVLETRREPGSKLSCESPTVDVDGSTLFGRTQARTVESPVGERCAMCEEDVCYAGDLELGACPGIVALADWRWLPRVYSPSALGT